LSNVKLYIVRHGTTIWNKEAKYQGQTDIALNDEGYHQAALISQRFASSKIKAIYSSPLQRARITAEIIAQPHLIVPTLLPGLLEIGFGEWEGQPYTKIREQYSEQLKHWIQDPLHYQIPGGEPLPELRQRVSDALETILSNHNDGDVILVGHSGTIRMLFCIILNMDLSSFWRIMQFNGAVNVVEYREKIPTVFSINDIQHLLK